MRFRYAGREVGVVHGLGRRPRPPRPLRRSRPRSSARPTSSRSAAGTRTRQRGDGAQREPRVGAGAAFVQTHRSRHAEQREVDAAPPPELQVGRAQAVRGRQAQLGEDLARSLAQVGDAVVPVQLGQRAGRALLSALTRRTEPSSTSATGARSEVVIAQQRSPPGREPADVGPPPSCRSRAPRASRRCGRSSRSGCPGRGCRRASRRSGSAGSRSAPRLGRAPRTGPSSAGCATSSQSRAPAPIETPPLTRISRSSSIPGSPTSTLATICCRLSFGKQVGAARDDGRLRAVLGEHRARLAELSRPEVRECGQPHHGSGLRRRLDALAARGSRTRASPSARRGRASPSRRGRAPSAPCRG